MNDNFFVLILAQLVFRKKKKKKKKKHEQELFTKPSSKGLFFLGKMNNYKNTS